MCNSFCHLFFFIKACLYFSRLLDAKKEELKEIKHEKETIQTTTKSTITLKLTSSSKSKSTETKTKTATTKKQDSTSIKTITPKSTITLKLTSSSKLKSTETKTATTKKPKSTKVANSQLVFSSSFLIKCNFYHIILYTINHPTTLHTHNETQ